MSANSTFTELVSTTFRRHRKEIKDNLSNRNALLKYVKRKGNYSLEDGGLTIATPLDYNANGTYQRYSDWDTLNISQSDVISAAEYQWRQIAINIVASGRELRINSGDSRIINLAKARMKNAIRTFNNNFSSDLYSAGSLTNQINGLQALVADTNTNTVGGIDASVWSFWQNKVFDLSVNSVTISATTIEGSAMLPLWLQLDRGPDDCPDLIVADNNYYSFFENSQTSLKRYSSSESANAGFVSLKYKKADVIYDGNSGIPANHMYFLNTEYLKLVVHKDADLTEVPEQRPVNQDGSVIPILWMGNLVASNRSQQGVIIA
ncbi:MAG: phage major capsid protein [Methylobacter sp.]|uniref:phage major capsid protein n=1 Tax=Methylobacter sp. TaxID=2051955 RepID=UPI0025FDEE70|nr:phage major capsid protein [Methylobacter sp.]MCK9622142.1 phage major capsid protein [Methylobacter sp.]